MLSAGSYRGRMGNRDYAHQTGGSMTGRAMRHSMQGNIMGGLGMHMGGVRMGSVLGASAWTPGQSAAPAPDISLLAQRSPLSGLGKGRAWRLGRCRLEACQRILDAALGRSLARLPVGHGRQGGHAVWLSETGAHVETVAEQRGRRPWTTTRGRGAR